MMVLGIRVNKSIGTPLLPSLKYTHYLKRGNRDGERLEIFALGFCVCRPTVLVVLQRQSWPSCSQKRLQIYTNYWTRLPPTLSCIFSL